MKWFDRSLLEHVFLSKFSEEARMTSAQPPLEHGFAAVDAQEDPHTWIRVLDTLGRDPLTSPTSVVYSRWSQRTTLLVRDQRAVDNVMGLHSWATTAYERGLLGAEDALAWPDAIDRAVASGRLLYAVTFFLAAGTRPSTSADRA